MKDVFCKWNCAKILLWGWKVGVGGGGAGGAGGGGAGINGISTKILSFFIAPPAQPSSSFALTEVPNLYIGARSALPLHQGASDFSRAAVAGLSATQRVSLSHARPPL